jgi:iron complex outermembrane receptor protein
LGSNNPKFKARLASSIVSGSLTLTGAVNYTHSFAVPTTNSTTGQRIECNTAVTATPALIAELGDCRVASVTTFDVGVGYRPTKNFSIQGSIRNLFNRQAPFDPSYTYYNTVMHNPAGATYGVTLRYTLN